jgi:alpha 1,3-glucosidase
LSFLQISPFLYNHSYIKDKDGSKDYDGWCWPGASSYLDFTAEHVRHWWAEQFGYDRYQGSTQTLFTWNDMNEPSVFNGPEVSMQKDLKNLAGHEHREWHNLYGMLFHRATAEGQIKRNKPSQDVRPFVLSRSFFAGTQRYGAIWTGDNTAEWSHLVVAAPMLLSLNAAALSFVGADVGGFFGNPDAELFTRWMQAGAYQPFFRGHAHHDSRRREPWMFDEETLHRLRRSAMERYALLPYWYTVFREAEMTGMPVMRMMWMQYPMTEALFGIEDQYMIGADLLVKPITAAGVTETEVLFPTEDCWYDVQTLQKISTLPRVASIEVLQVPAPIDKIPVFQRGGSVIARKLRLRRSTMMMKTDPYTLFVALGVSKTAKGALYMDDEDTFGYGKRHEYANSTFTADWRGTDATLVNSVTIGSGWQEFSDKLASDRMVERIIIMGVETHPKSIQLHGGNALEFTYSPHTNSVVIRKPELSAMAEWTIYITSS